MKTLLAVTLVAVCGAAISVIYYFALYLPNSRKTDNTEQSAQQTIQLMELQRRCMEDGTKAYLQLRREISDPATAWDPGEFHVNKRLNACLMHTRRVRPLGEGASLQYNELFDVYEHRPIFYGWVKRDTSTNPWKEEPLETLDDKPNYDTTRYFVEKEKLFKE
jgi:hypothetical protein